MFVRITALVIGCVGVLVLSGCFGPPLAEDEFAALAHEWSPPGTDVAEATQRYKAAGFTVDRFLPEPRWPDQRPYLWVSRKEWASWRTPFMWMCSREWRVILPIESEAVVEVKSLIGLTCL